MEGWAVYELAHLALVGLGILFWRVWGRRRRPAPMTEAQVTAMIFERSAYFRGRPDRQAEFAAQHARWDMPAEEAFARLLAEHESALKTPERNAPATPRRAGALAARSRSGARGS